MERLIIYAFAVWRLTTMIVIEDGPWDIFCIFRHFVGIRYNEMSEPYGETMIAKALTCFFCASVWVAMILLPIYFYNVYILLPFAVSGAAIIVGGENGNG